MRIKRNEVSEEPGHSARWCGVKETCAAYDDSRELCAQARAKRACFMLVFYAHGTVISWVALIFTLADVCCVCVSVSVFNVTLVFLAE